MESPETTDTLSGTLRTSSLRFCAVMTTKPSPATLGSGVESGDAVACCASALVNAKQASAVTDRTAGIRCFFDIVCPSGCEIECRNEMELTTFLHRPERGVRQ